MCQAAAECRHEGGTYRGRVKGTVVVTSRCMHACAYIFFVLAEPIASLLPSEPSASSSSSSSSRLVVLRAKDGAPHCAGPTDRFQPIMGAVGWNERPNGRATDRHAPGDRPPRASRAEHLGQSTCREELCNFSVGEGSSYPFWLWHRFLMCVVRHPLQGTQAGAIKGPGARADERSFGRHPQQLVHDPGH